MAHQPHVRSLHSSYYSTLKTPFPTSASLKIKTLLQAHIFRHIGHVVRALASAKSMAMELLKAKNTSINNHNNKLMRMKKKKKKFLSSITVHRNRSSSHVIPMPEAPIVEGLDVSHGHLYYDSTWNSVISTEEITGEFMEPPLSGYLRWLEEKNPEELAADIDDGSEIDRLAEKFIARCHEKFRLEKVESYRRYQEMLARSM